MTRRAAQKLLRCCQTCRLSLPICSLRLAHSWKVAERHGGAAGCYSNPISTVSLPGKLLSLRKPGCVIPLGVGGMPPDIGAWEPIDDGSARRVFVRQPLQQNRHH